MNSVFSSSESSRAANGPLNPAAAFVPALGIAPLFLLGGSGLGFAACVGSAAGWVALWSVEHATEQLDQISKYFHRQQCRLTMVDSTCCTCIFLPSRCRRRKASSWRCCFWPMKLELSLSFLSQQLFLASRRPPSQSYLHLAYPLR